MKLYGERGVRGGVMADLDADVLLLRMLRERPAGTVAWPAGSHVGMLAGAGAATAYTAADLVAMLRRRGGAAIWDAGARK